MPCVLHAASRDSKPFVRLYYVYVDGRVWGGPALNLGRRCREDLQFIVCFLFSCISMSRHSPDKAGINSIGSAPAATRLQLRAGQAPTPTSSDDGAIVEAAASSGADPRQRGLKSCRSSLLLPPPGCFSTSPSTPPSFYSYPFLAHHGPSGCPPQGCLVSETAPAFLLPHCPRGSPPPTPPCRHGARLIHHPQRGV